MKHDRTSQTANGNARTSAIDDPGDRAFIILISVSHLSHLRLNLRSHFFTLSFETENGYNAHSHFSLTVSCLSHYEKTLVYQGFQQ